MKLLRYLSQYRFHQMGALIQNEKKTPASCKQSIQGKTIILTGATSGIGLETARFFAEKGANLICVNRNREKSALLEEELKNKFDSQVQTIIADFSSMEQTKKCADILLHLKNPIDTVIHNAGVFSTTRCITDDGIELVFQVNHLSAFLLNYILRERLKEENRARIIYVNSEGHRFALSGVHLNDLKWKRHLYTGLKSYGAAKTAQLLTMLQFKDFFSGSSVTINAMHPGNVESRMGENNGRFYRFMKQKFILPFSKNATQSAEALYFLSASEEVKNLSGLFFNLTTQEEPAPHAKDRNAAVEVWNKSLQLCGLK